METLSIGEFKGRFSEVLEKVKQGRRVAIGYGKKKVKVAILIPFHRLSPKTQRKLGPLKGKAECSFSRDFSISDEDFLSS